MADIARHVVETHFEPTVLRAWQILLATLSGAVHLKKRGLKMRVGDMEGDVRQALAAGGRRHYRRVRRGGVHALCAIHRQQAHDLRHQTRRLRIRGRARGLHSFTSQLNLSAFCGIGGVCRGCLGVFRRC